MLRGLNLHEDQIRSHTKVIKGLILPISWFRQYKEMVISRHLMAPPSAKADLEPMLPTGRSWSILSWEDHSQQNRPEGVVGSGPSCQKLYLLVAESRRCNVYWHCRPLCLVRLEIRRLEQVATVLLEPALFPPPVSTPSQIMLHQTFEDTTACSSPRFVHCGCFAGNQSQVKWRRGFIGRRSAENTYRPDVVLFFVQLVDLDRSMSSQCEPIDVDGR